ncbi:MAG TPA: efflux RND transporter periplasmic adaptor subunit [Anaerolineales bacterium]|nr:efflux RND transporter periplasmic adaptor subunit [Anaerolineales bacterium]HMX20120.1 efflux RND transporter periplasmic adaptor subunit [Anaerolineales bacterium]HNA52838.1 efflux RND transporter periplasmic adaptor subunit [Anaerolineales bacterium]HNB86157.1 efflux RND transporter periplasmic adaptor subunit [Anaerolineales bacterium]HNC87392.1 efflux RND transporter periplasmic adaptor subunit [Anaerolineales bacterium]
MKQFFSKITRRTWVIIGVLAVVVLAIVFFSTRSSGEPLYQTTTVERGNLVATVGATGSVRARQSAVLIWQTTGIVKDIYMEVGNPVKRDEILASLDKNSLNQSVILAESDLAAAEKALADLLNSDTARAQALRTVDAAEEAYKKAYDYRLELNGLITITETYLVRGVPKVRTYKGYADAETIADADEKLALAEAQLNDARRNLDRLQNGVDPAELAAAEGRVAAAQSTMNMAHIIAPFDGVITQSEPSVGDQVTAGTVAFRIDDVSHMLVDLQVSEVDINNVAIGQPAVLTFDAILGKEYHGEVVEVGQAGDTVQGVVSFTVTVELTDADELVKPGMTAAVNVVIEEQKDMLLIPNRAVRLVDGERVVYLLVDGQPVQVKIKLGSSSDTMSVLAEGDIKEGDLIILNPPSNNGGPFGG